LFPKATAHETIIKKAADTIFIEKEAPKVEAFENQLCPTIIQEIDEEMSEIKKQKHSAPRDQAEFLHLSDSPIQIQIKQFGQQRPPQRTSILQKIKEKQGQISLCDPKRLRLPNNSETVTLLQ